MKHQQLKHYFSTVSWHLWHSIFEHDTGITLQRFRLDTDVEVKAFSVQGLLQFALLLQQCLVERVQQARLRRFSEQQLVDVGDVASQRTREREPVGRREREDSLVAVFEVEVETESGRVFRAFVPERLPDGVLQTLARLRADLARA